MRLPPLLVLLAACGSNSADPDAAPATGDTLLADAKLIDAKPMIDAPPPEVCSSAGWCQVAMPPSYIWAMSVAPDAQPWTVAYGVRTKAPGGWVFHDLSWQSIADPFVFYTELYTVYAVSNTDVWVGGQGGYVGHYNGSSWQEFRPAAPWPQGIWGAASNDVWIFYDSSLRYHWNGSTLASTPSSTVRSSGAWGTAANDVWNYGETSISNLYYPAVEHFDGTTWTRTVLPGFGTVISFWDSSATDLYAVITLNGTTRLMHGDGTTWTQVGPANMQVYAVWGRAANDVWAVGKQGAIAHWDGATWSMSNSGTTLHLSQLGGTATTIWATGAGVALRKP